MSRMPLCKQLPTFSRFQSGIHLLKAKLVVKSVENQWKIVLSWQTFLWWVGIVVADWSHCVTSGKSRVNHSKHRVSHCLSSSWNRSFCSCALDYSPRYPSSTERDSLFQSIFPISHVSSLFSPAIPSTKEDNDCSINSSTSCSSECLPQQVSRETYTLFSIFWSV